MALLRYGGTLMHVSRDEDGPIEVVDEDGVRAMHFGTSSRQSAMNLADPEQLELSYTRAMLSALLFHDSPRRILMVGLGGGSLAKYLLRQLPEARIDVAEKRANVVKIAHGWFGLPEDPRLDIHVGDGMAFVDKAAPDSYDLILVDAYHGYGMAAEIAQHAFYQRCSLLLTTGGVLATNLWGNDAPILARSLRMLEEHYARPVLQLHVQGKGNVIGLAFNRTPSNAVMKGLREKAFALQQRWGLEFVLFAKQLRRANTAWMDWL
ncbi:hypothetical protein [Methylogaea oryzae]|nr:hypothetical protein [Methylogaea oryzae]